MTKNACYELFKEKVLKHLSDYKNEFLGIDGNGKWLINKIEYPHILPIELKMLNLLPTVQMLEGVEEHVYSHHLNSSQMMCINFFQPLFNDSTGKDILLKLLIQTIGIQCPTSAKIIDRCFEYRPCEKERTSFDLYIRLTDNIEVFFEIKYTENCFGKIGSAKDNPNKYADKWRDIYTPHLANSLYLKDMKQYEFYKDYQIWRNVSYVQNENNYAVFIIPQQNETLIAELEETVGLMELSRFENIKTVYWDDLVLSSLKYSRNTEYFSHFKLFYDKYMSFMIADNS